MEMLPPFSSFQLRIAKLNSKGGKNHLIAIYLKTVKYRVE